MFTLAPRNKTPPALQLHGAVKGHEQLASPSACEADLEGILLLFDNTETASDSIYPH